ncbi:hypothetical protein AA904_02035 [Geobacillus stearothermophilus]|uniref:Uncharacterized protein n=1 Tax=Geobacillus stearothermophilus TaxID=1422 RepID=A0A3L7D7U9_GEOSE|nr:hypothetical protein AA906_03020 [Geobacillus stearothermophilus]KMY63884.1 hypothetical protein AA904_02035 [Geobacillus stearothermophilus]RLP99399.1 hypothetical protein D9545_10880 [Geobacillus stearothermophilus]RLQ07089.1 hypothetical protein D9549_11180 [Geobacillus stearothermophilus]RLQ08317.1 hypothetical protein D9547_11105 [Geobacillus stearothermophilus]
MVLLFFRMLPSDGRSCFVKASFHSADKSGFRRARGGVAAPMFRPFFRRPARSSFSANGKQYE